MQHTSVLDDNYLAITLLVTCGYQLVFFIVTVLARFDKVTDLAGGSNFAVLALLTFLLARTYYARQCVVTALVVVWALRLAGFLLYRILLWGEDRRFDDTRHNLGRLVVFWIFQAVWVWTVSLPVTILNAGSRPQSAGRPLFAADYVGWVLWAIGFALEAVADGQKLRYKQRRPEHRPTEWCAVGVWRYSRHPNYFGEMLLWWGVFIACTAAFDGEAALWIAGVTSPVFLTLLLLLVSGLPMLEKSMDQRFGTSAAPPEVRTRYRQYKRETSPLLPLPPSLYRRLPRGLKRWLLLEWPLYNPAEAVAVSDKAAPTTADAATLRHPTETAVAADTAVPTFEDPPAAKYGAIR